MNKRELFLSDLALKLFGKCVEKNKKIFQNFRAAIVSSGIEILSVTYISCMLLYLCIAPFISLIFSTFIIFVLKFIIINWLVDILIYILIFEILTFLIFFSYPYIKMSNNTAEIDSNLPFALIHMQTIAESGAPPIVIFKLLSNFKEYGYLSKEFQKISRNIEMFGMDNISAIRDVMLKTPSSNLKDILSGMITTIQSGGKLSQYISERAEQMLFEYKLSRRKYEETLTAYADIYTAILIAAPLMLVIVLTIIATIGGNVFGIPPSLLIIISVYGIVPSLNLIFLIFLLITQPKGG
ncbi:MAG: type II secretion system F family protein [Candidatus Aenigmatarchaeota archaeon]